MSHRSDWLSSVISILKLRGRFDPMRTYQNGCRTTVGAGSPGEIPFYMMLEGSVELDCATAETQYLNPGEIILVPHGTAHSLHYISHTKIISGRLYVASPHERIVSKYLPESLVVRKSDAPSATAAKLDIFLSIVKVESNTDDHLASVALDPLAPVLFVISFRAVSQSERPSIGLVAAAGCKKLAPVIESLFAEPFKSWTLQSLAALCGVSRPTLLQCFKSTVGCSPMVLLMDIRMALAANELKKAKAPVNSVSRAIGYRSVTAFRRAFTRHFGMTPTAWRNSVSRNL